MSAEDDDDAFPRSMRHRKVLDVAEEHPDASIDEIASMVPSATADLVEHVFDQHGDPAAEEADQAAADESEPATEDDHQESEQSDEPPTESEESDEADAPAAGSVSQTDADGPTGVPLATLSDRKRELLEVVAARPDATQGEIADHFDVTRATVSRWASEIEGFEWSDRAEVVARTVGTPSTAVSTDGGSTAETASGENGEAPAAPDGATGDFAARLDGLESRLADLESAGSADDGVDVELAHKIAHACLQSEAISEDEELRILEWLLE